MTDYDDFEYIRALVQYGELENERRRLLGQQILMIEQLPETTYRDADGVDVKAHRQDQHTIFVLRRDFSPAIEKAAKELNPLAAYVMLTVE